MTFGKGEATFSSDERVKLPNKKPQVYGKINYFLTEVIYFFPFSRSAVFFLGPQQQQQRHTYIAIMYSVV